MLAKSLSVKIAAFCTLALAVVLGSGAFIMTMRGADALHRQNEAIQTNVANSQAEAVSRKLDLAASVAESLGASALALKQSGVTDRAV